MIVSDASHKQRIHQELAKAGMTSYGFLKGSSRYLQTVVHEGEHVLAVAYGRYGGGSGMLVGTDRRIVFLDHKPGFTVCDEIGFDSVLGVKSAFTGAFSTVTLHTRVGDYQLRYVNHTCAHRFVAYVEQKKDSGKASPKLSEADAYRVAMAMSPEAKAFLLSHDTAVLSSEDRRGNLYGAVVYYHVGPEDKIYLLTRSETAKARNVLAHQQIALTIYDADPAQTLQIHGVAMIETDQKIKDEIFSKMISPRKYKGGTLLPPVNALREGSYVVIAITPTTATYHPYQAAIKDSK